VIIQKFALISISPPTNAPDIDVTLSKIAEKQKWFEENGESAMREKIKELKQQIHLQELEEQT
jgi:anti-sigma28 factor (negative regulator of flagellin synthesis)